MLLRSLEIQSQKPKCQLILSHNPAPLMHRTATFSLYLFFSLSPSSRLLSSSLNFCYSPFVLTRVFFYFFSFCCSPFPLTFCFLSSPYSHLNSCSTLLASLFVLHLQYLPFLVYSISSPILRTPLVFSYTVLFSPALLLVSPLPLFSLLYTFTFSPHCLHLFSPLFLSL
jgi:hypothetical protein